MPRCHRCGKESEITFTGPFCADWLCPACKEKETKRSDFEKAVEAPSEVEREDYSYPDIVTPGKDGINFYR